MAKAISQFFLIGLSFFILSANFGYSVINHDSVKQSDVEFVENSCCGQVNDSDNCCSVELNYCQTNDYSGCCCFEEHQVVQFSFNVPIESAVKSPSFLTLFSLKIIPNIINVSQFNCKIFAGELHPPALNQRLALLQTYII